MSNDKPQGTERVDIIASGYEWTCPTCDTLNKEISCPEVVTCSREDCRVSFFTDSPEHCMG